MPARTGSVTGEWRDIAFLNYRVSPGLLEPHLPDGVDPDPWRGECIVSVVGIHIRDLRVGGVPAPLYREYAQVNLRLCVRRHAPADGAVRRGVVLLRELVPRPVLSGWALPLGGEPLQPAVVRRGTAADAREEAPTVAEYVWDELIRGGRLFVEGRGAAGLPGEGSLEEFVLERPWGYAGRRGEATAEYRFEHPRWTIRVAERAQLSGNLASTFGEEFADVLHAPPSSAFLARGSEVSVHASA